MSLHDDHALKSDAQARISRWEAELNVAPFVEDRRHSPARRVVGERRHVLGERPQDYERRVSELERMLIGDSDEADR